MIKLGIGIVGTGLICILAASAASAAPAACSTLVKALKSVEHCHRPLLRKHLCSGMAPQEFERIITTACRSVRETARPCLVNGYVRQGISPKEARDGAAEVLNSALGLEMNIYTAQYEGRLKDKAFQCPRS